MTKLLRVPLIDFVSVPHAKQLQSAMPNLVAVFSSWTDEDAVRVAAWLRRETEAIAKLKWEPNARPKGELGYVPFYDPNDGASRGLAEAPALDTIAVRDLWRSIDDDALPDFLLKIGRLIGAPSAFRQSPLRTRADRSGDAILYPCPSNINAQLRALSLWLAINRNARFGCAAVAMTVICNLHPFDDYNGRCGRLMFNLLCRTDDACRPYVPLHEFGILSAGAFIVRLRTAQYHGHWEPLLDYLDTCGRFLNEVVLARR